MKLFKALYTTPRLYLIASGIVLLYILGYFNDTIFFAAKLLVLLFIIVLAADLAILFFYRQKILLLRRDLPERLSNGDDNAIEIYIKNESFLTLSIRIIDEIPYQFQIRNFKMKLELVPGAERKLTYHLKPMERGEYDFGHTLAYATSRIGLLERRFSFGNSSTKVKVYPSFIQMRKYELLAISNRLTETGVKRVRKIGTYSEFDQIKEYVKGDNYRTINWKATAKHAKLMANQYQEERSQNVYSLIDMGRVMKMPFEGMTLLDYAINASLVISNTAVFKHDRAGILSFNATIESYLPAERKNRTLHRIMELLYKQQTKFLESNYESVSAFTRRHIAHRSLLILYTNFESTSSLERQMSYLKSLAKNHLLMVVIFENTEVNSMTQQPARTLNEIYMKTIAEKFIYDKKRIIHELNRHGILGLLTKPESLSVNLINKYLELKTQGRI